MFSLPSFLHNQSSVGICRDLSWNKSFRSGEVVVIRASCSFVQIRNIWPVHIRSDASHSFSIYLFLTNALVGVRWNLDPGPLITLLLLRIDLQLAGPKIHNRRQSLSWRNLSRFCLCRASEPVSVASDDFGQSDRDLLADWCLVAEGSVPECSEYQFRSDWGWLADWCLETEDSLPVHLGDEDLGRCRSDLSWLVDWCLAEESVPVRLGEEDLGWCRSDLSWLDDWCCEAEKSFPVCSAGKWESDPCWLADAKIQRSWLKEGFRVRWNSSWWGVRRGNLYSRWKSRL